MMAMLKMSSLVLAVANDIDVEGWASLWAPPLEVISPMVDGGSNMRERGSWHHCCRPMVACNKSNQCSLLWLMVGVAQKKGEEALSSSANGGM